MKPIKTADRILVIKHGALGDFVLALPAMKAIRAHFPSAKITLQTTPGLAGFAEICPFIDGFDPDGRRKGVGELLALGGRVRAGRYDVVYDLQNSERTSLLHLLIGPGGPKWNGVAFAASYQVKDKLRLTKHPIERLAEQVALTGIPKTAATDNPELGWAVAKGKPPQAFGLEGRYLMLAARASATRSVKIWPAERYAEIARLALAQSITPVLIGTASEREQLDAITHLAPGTLNLAGQTALPDLASLGASATGLLGNDTGPTFVAAASGAVSAVLYSRHSLPPEICGPRGPREVAIVFGEEVGDITVEAVAGALARAGVLGTG